MRNGRWRGIHDRTTSRELVLRRPLRGRRVRSRRHPTRCVRGCGVSGALRLRGRARPRLPGRRPGRARSRRVGGCRRTARARPGGRPRRRGRARRVRWRRAGAGLPFRRRLCRGLPGPDRLPRALLRRGDGPVRHGRGARGRGVRRRRCVYERRGVHGGGLCGHPAGVRRRQRVYGQRLRPRVGVVPLHGAERRGVRRRQPVYDGRCVRRRGLHGSGDARMRLPAGRGLRERALFRAAGLRERGGLLRRRARQRRRRPDRLCRRRLRGQRGPRRAQLRAGGRDDVPRRFRQRRRRCRRLCRPRLRWPFVRRRAVLHARRDL